MLPFVLYSGMYHFTKDPWATRPDRWIIKHGGDIFAHVTCPEENVQKMVDSLNLDSAPCYVCQSKEHAATECTA